MIDLSDDYVVKYQDTISYFISRAIHDGYSFSHIEYSIAHSSIIEEFEKSNITLIAFSSMEKNYNLVFPFSKNDGFILNVYDKYGWSGFIYLHLFFDLKMTFEALFMVIPIEEMLSCYPLYHEMDYRQMLKYVKEKIKHSTLDVIMKQRNVSTKELSMMTGINYSTLNAIRYNKRDIDKMESKKLYLISKALNVKTESLLSHLELDFDR